MLFHKREIFLSKILLLGLLYFVLPTQSYAQKNAVPDSVKRVSSIPNSDVEGRKRKKEKKPQLENVGQPTKAAFLALVFPGMGQIYNKRYWKLPIFYGGLGAFYFIIQQNHTEYIFARNNLAYLADGDPNNDVLIPERFENFTVDNWVNRRDRFRRDRDYFIMIGIIWYGLSAMDAAVDAHLKNYNVSTDLSMKIQPDLILNPMNALRPTIGLKMTFTLGENSSKDKLN